MTPVTAVIDDIMNISNCVNDSDISVVSLTICVFNII
jgi:hypothetical protein